MNKDKRLKIGVNARKDVEQHFDKKRMVDDLVSNTDGINLFSSLLN